MSKTILLFVIILFLGCQLYAQDAADNSFKRFGFVAGMNLANMNFNKGVPAPSTPVKASWKSGITFGFLISIPLAENLLLQPEYFYTKRRSADNSSGINYFIDYVSMPLLLNYKISSMFALVAGPQAELLINARSNSNGVNTNITHDTEERSIGATAGFNVKLPGSFFLSARYLYGLNHIGIGQRSNLKEFKYEVVNLAIGVRF